MWFTFGVVYAKEKRAYFNPSIPAEVKEIRGQSIPLCTLYK